MATLPRILVVGANADSDALTELLRLEGYEVAQTARAQLSAAASAEPPGLVIADVAFPQTDGPALLDELQGMARRPRTILVSSRPSVLLAPLGVTCLEKPLDLPALWRLLEAEEGAAGQPAA